MATKQHRRFDKGINQDDGSFLLDEGYVYSSKNMLYDKVGIIRKRGGIIGVGNTAVQNSYQFGILATDDGLMRPYALGKGFPVLHYMNPTTGVQQNLFGSGNFGDLNIDAGRPFQHQGFLFWPCYTTSGLVPATALAAVGGSTGALSTYSFVTPGSVVCTAGDKRITCAVVDNPPATTEVGHIVAIFGTPVTYIGRVTALVDSTHFEVYPTPTVTITTCTLCNFYPGWYTTLTSLGGALPPVGGRIGMSYQGRVVLGNICYKPNRLELYPRRVWFSTTILEGDIAATQLYQGATYMTLNGYPALNWFDIPGQDPLTAMSPTGFGDAVFFSSQRAYRMTGNLSTQYGTTPSVTWKVAEIPNSVGCLSERSLQRTPRGIIFAHSSGIYATDGASMQPLMYGRIGNLWRNLVGGTGFLIHGSALIRGNHYMISGASGGSLWCLLLNMDTLAWSPLSGKTTSPSCTDIGMSAQDPTNPGTTYAVRWYDITGTVPTMTQGTLMKLETMFNPNPSSRSDQDTTAVNFEVVTKPYTEDTPTLQKTWQKSTIEYANQGGQNVGVTPAAVLDASEMPAGGTAYRLDIQNVLTVTGATNASPIVLTTSTSHFLNPDTWVHVQGIGGNTAANGPWRIQAVPSGTQITLMGSVGNGAYTSGGTVQAMDTKDIPLDAVAQTAQSNNAAMVYRINDTDLGGNAGADSFELYGITHSWEERDPHTE